MRTFQSILAAFLCTTLATSAGCELAGLGWGSQKNLVKPTIAVPKFESRAAATPNWNVGEGMAELVANRLLATGRYQVLERTELQPPAQTPAQSPPPSRPQSRLKNVQYMVKGTITDFGLVGPSNFWEKLFGGGNKAVVALTLQIVDVETGQILVCETVQDTVRAKDLDMQPYQNVVLSSRAFYDTPLGEAAYSVLDTIVKKVTSTIPMRVWEPKIALVQSDGGVVINGGEDRKITLGSCYEVLQAGEPILDPDTGEVLGQQPSRAVGRVQISRVEARFSRAVVMGHSSEPLQLGQRCRLMSEGR